MQKYVRICILTSLCLTLASCSSQAPKKSINTISEASESKPLLTSTVTTDSPNQESQPATSTEANKALKPIDAAKLTEFFNALSNLHTGTAGCSLQIAGTAATWLNEPCTSEIDYTNLEEAFSAYLSQLKPEQKETLTTSYELLTDYADKLVTNDKDVLALAKDGGVELNSQAVKETYWQKVKAAINDVLKAQKLTSPKEAN